MKATLTKKKKSYLLPPCVRVEEFRLVTGYRFKVSPGHGAGLEVSAPELDPDKASSQAAWPCLCWHVSCTWTWTRVPDLGPARARPLCLHEDLFLKGGHLATPDLEFSPLLT